VKKGQTISKAASKNAKAVAKTGKELLRNPGPSGAPGQIVSRANRWREQYNPLRGLTLQRAVQMFDAFQRGDLPDLMWIYRFIERRHPVLRAGILRRRSALLRLDWDIKIVEEDKLPPGSTKADAEAQAQTLRNAYDAIDNLKEAIRHMALSEFRGFSVLQKHYADGDVNHLEVLNHWNFSREGLFGDFYWNAASVPCSDPSVALGEDNRIGSDAMPRTDFVVREVDMPVNEIGLLCFIRRGLSQKDWDAFIEIYGLPSGVITMASNVPAGKEDEYRDAAKQIAEGGSGAIPYSSTYTANDSPRGVNPFKDHIRSIDEDLVLAITGGKLTMLAESGSGTLAGGAHQEAFDEIAQAEAAEISEVFQTDFDAPILSREHPAQPQLAYFEIAAADQTDIDGLCKNVQQLSNAGYKADVEWLKEKTGYELTEQPPEKIDVRAQGPVPNVDGEGKIIMPTVPAAKVANRAQRILNAAREQTSLDAHSQTQFVSSIAADLKPLADRLQAILQIQDPQIRQTRLKALYEEMDALKKDITADPHAGVALTNINAAQLANGAAAAAAKRK
jgi:phage gp29-like protein